MFNKISTSYNLVKVSLKYIKRDGELLIYSILSLLSSLAILVTFIWVDFYFFGFSETVKEWVNSWAETSESTQNILMYVYMFVYYLVFSFITFFFNTAIITSVQRRNNWEDNKLWDGLRDAMAHLKEIFIWSLINATVTTILKALQNKFWEDSIVWRIIFWLIGGLWNILTFFSFPLMIINKMGPKDAIKESSILFKKTWGERAIIHVWVWIMFFFMYLIILILWIAIMVAGLYTTWIVILILGAIFLVILSSTCDVIIKTILLHYAQTGSLPDGLEHNKKIIEIAWNKE